jgi:beta-phosphoglucomutase-like phosphatase (HAD superfamily)
MVAAKAAGMKCVVVPNPITAGLDFAEADLLLPSLTEATLPTLQRLFVA